MALGIAAMLAAVSLIAPTLLKPLNILWFQFGLLLHRVVNPIVMFALFALVFVPAGIMRILRDPLRSRRPTEVSSYWIDCSEEGHGLHERSILSPTHEVRVALEGNAPMLTLAREFFAYMGARKKWWLLPILLVLLVFGGLLISRRVPPSRRSSTRCSE